MNDRPKSENRPVRPPALPLAARWGVRLLAVLPSVLLLLASLNYFGVVVRLLKANLVPIAAGELTRQLGHEVRIARATYNHRGVLILDGIAISNKATFAQGHGEATLTADRLTIDYNLHDLLFDSGNAAHALRDITLDRPTLLIERFAGNRFNFSDLLAPKGPQKGKPFVGRLIVHDGALHLRDFQAPALLHERPANNTLTHIAATVDFGSERFVFFDVAGQGSDNRLGTVRLRGDASRLAAGRYRVSAQAMDADAAYWAAYFKAFPQAHVAAGRADVDMNLARLGSKPPPGLPLDMQGHVTLRDATIAVTDKRFLHQPLRHLTGNATFTGAGVAFDGRFSVAEQPLTATGTLFDFKHPQVAATITSALVEPGRLASALPILKLPPGARVSPGPATVQLTGSPANPAISANLAFPSVFYAGNRATDVRAQVVYVNKILSIPSATFGLNGSGQASLRGSVALTGKTPIVLLAGQARNVDLAALALPPALARQHLGLGGRADVAFLASSQGHPLSVVANLSAKNLSARGMTLSGARGRVSWSMGGPLTIARASLQDPKGTAIVSGTIPGGQKGAVWNLSVQASHLDLARLSRPFTRLDVAGLADFQGHVGGTASAPQASGDIQLYEPRLGRYGADAVQGALTASTGGIRLENIRIHRFPTEADVSGTITRLASQNPALDLNVKVSQGDVQDFLSLARQVNPAIQTASASTLSAALPTLTGTAEGELRITGRLKSPQIAGRAQIADATVGAYRIDRVSANFSYADGGLQVRNGLVQAGGSTVTAEGSRDRQGRLEARVTGREINLNQFYRLTDPYADVAGTVSFSGTASGTPQSPIINIEQLFAENLTVDGQQFAPVTLAGRYADGVITQTGAPWEFAVQLPKRQQADGQTQIRYLLNKFSLALPTPSDPKRQASLTLDAQIPAQTPEQVSHLLRTLRLSRFARTPAGKNLLAQIRDLPQPLAGSLSVSQLTVDGPLSAPDVHADLQASNLALGETRVNGLTAKVHYQGGADPSAHLTANADNLLLAGVPIGKAGADADYANRVVSLHSLSASSERAFLQASGRADLDGKISGTLEASNIPLTLFQSFAPNADAAFRVLPREISALSVTASGETRSPDLIASVSLANPAAAPSASDSAATYSLDRVRSGAISLMSATPGSRDKVLAISDLAAFKNGRLVATLSGTLPVQLGPASKIDTVAGLPNQALHADLRVQDLSVLSLFSPGLIDPKKTSGSLIGSVNVVGEGAARRIAGMVTMTHGSVGLVGFDTALQKLGGQVLLDDGRLTEEGFAGHVSVNNFAGQSSKGGGFTLSGTGTLGKGGEANLQMAAKNLSVDETSQKSTLVDKFKSGLRGKITGALTVKGPWLTPRVATTGATPLLISEAVLTLPGATGAQGTSSTAPAFNPQFDLHMDIGGKGKTISVRSALLQADANGDLAVGGDLSQPELIGHFSVYKGYFNLPPSTRLRFIRPVGTVDLTYPVSLPSPLGGDQPGMETRVDLTAQANVSVSPNVLAANTSAVQNSFGGPASQGFLAGGSLDRPRRYTIKAHIYGLLSVPDRLNIDLESSPGGLQRSQMLAALVPAGTLGSLFGGGTGAQRGLEEEFKNALNAVAIPTLLQPFETQIANTFGLSDFSVDYSPNGTLVTLIRPITPRLEATYIRSVGSRTPGPVNSLLSTPQYTLKLGYGLTDRLQFSLSTDDQRNNTVALEGVYNF